MPPEESILKDVFIFFSSIFLTTISHFFLSSSSYNGICPLWKYLSIDWSSTIPHTPISGDQVILIFSKKVKELLQSHWKVNILGLFIPLYLVSALDEEGNWILLASSQQALWAQLHSPDSTLKWTHFVSNIQMLFFHLCVFILGAERLLQSQTAYLL